MDKCVYIYIYVDISIYKQQRYRCIYGLMTTPTASFSTLLVPPTVLSYSHGIYAAPQNLLAVARGIALNQNDKSKYRYYKVTNDIMNMPTIRAIYIYMYIYTDIHV